MTPEEINREIAKKVMQAPELWPKWFRRDGERWYFLQDGYPAYWECYTLWSPYTRIDHAWMVVEKISDCLHLKEHGPEGKWAAMFCSRTMWFSADTAQAAICLAALEAVKEKKG